MVNSAAIGMFDSGIGGLSVARAVRDLLPNERLIYVADTGHAPYGEKNDDYIYQRMQLISQHLQQQGVKAIVVACNTATTAAIAKLRAHYSLPIIGVEPGVKPAVLASKNGVVGVLATPRTLQTPAFASLAKRFAGQARIELQPCPQLVQLIENLDFSGAQMQAVLTSYIEPLLEKGADTLVLGCTHYNFVADAIAAIAGPAVTIIRTEAAVAHQLRQRLLQAQLLADPKIDQPYSSLTTTFYSSGNLELFRRQLQRLWPGAGNPHPL